MFFVQSSCSNIVYPTHVIDAEYFVWSLNMDHSYFSWFLSLLKCWFPHVSRCCLISWFFKCKRCFFFLMSRVLQKFLFLFKFQEFSHRFFFRLYLEIYIFQNEVFWLKEPKTKYIVIRGVKLIFLKTKKQFMDFSFVLSLCTFSSLVVVDGFCHRSYFFKKQVTVIRE